MQSPCYRCGSPVEDQTTFCPSCGAPQIRVTAPAIVAETEPSTPPLPPGTPASIEPPAVPVHLEPAAQINWRQFLRTAVPLGLLGGIAVAYTGLLGIVIFVAMIVISVIRYRSHSPAQLSPSQGARLGAVAGLLGCIVVLILTAVVVMANPDEVRGQLASAMKQRLAGNPDPHAQQFVQWAATNQGLLVFGILGAFLTLVLCVIISSAIGAIAVSLYSNKNRR